MTDQEAIKNLNRVRTRHSGNVRVNVHRHKSEHSNFSNITISIERQDVVTARVSPPRAALSWDGDQYINWSAIGSQSIDMTNDFITALRYAISEVKRECKWWGIELDTSVQRIPCHAVPMARGRAGQNETL